MVMLEVDEVWMTLDETWNECPGDQGFGSPDSTSILSSVVNEAPFGMSSGRIF